MASEKLLGWHLPVSLAGFYPSLVHIKSAACLLFLDCPLCRECYVFLPIGAPDSEADLFLLVNPPLPLAIFAEHVTEKEVVPRACKSRMETGSG